MDALYFFLDSCTMRGFILTYGAGGEHVRSVQTHKRRMNVNQVIYSEVQKVLYESKKKEPFFVDVPNMKYLKFD